MFVFGCFILRRQRIVPFNLPDNCQAMDDVFAFGWSNGTHIHNLLCLLRIFPVIFLSRRCWFYWFMNRIYFLFLFF